MFAVEETLWEDKLPGLTVDIALPIEPFFFFLFFPGNLSGRPSGPEQHCLCSRHVLRASAIPHVAFFLSAEAGGQQKREQE